MFSEILKVIPKLDGAALAGMERSLSGRFASVAKKFGGGLKNAIFGGFIATVAIKVLDKILNPLKEVQENLEKLLGQADDLNTFAKQFGTTSGKLFNLQTLAAAKGVSAEDLRVMLLKFQGAITDAKANPGVASPVSGFVNETDLADAFFKFIQNMQKLTDAQKNFVQQAVFGEKQILKMSEFVNEKDFAGLMQRLKLQDPTLVTMLVNEKSKISDKNQELSAVRNAEGFLEGISKVRPGMVTSTDVQERLRISKENDALGSYQNIAKVATGIDRIEAQVEKGALAILNNLPALINGFVELSNIIAGNGAIGKTIAADVSAIAKSRQTRGATPKGDK